LGYLPFAPESEARLWIDLAGPRDPAKNQYDFYLCTKDNPFGRNLTKDERRRALIEINKQEFDDSELFLDSTFPFKAKIPIPFVELCEWIKEGKCIDGIIKNRSKEDLNLSEDAYSKIQEKLSNGNFDSEFINNLFIVARDVVFGDGYSVPLILIEKRGKWMTEKKLGKLFERVNINGLVPPQAELFFSALKLRMPEINNYVAEVYNDKVIGRLLKPTDIILSAFRMADNKIDSLRLDQFDKYTLLHHDQLRSLMEKKNEEKSIFGRCMQIAYEVLHHNGLDGDIGLPRQFFAGLRSRVWQTALIWIEKNLPHIESDGISLADRLNIIRYAVLDSLNFNIQWQRNLSNFVNNTWFLKDPGEFVCDKPHFPGHELYKLMQNKIIENNFKSVFRDPKTYSAWLSSGIESGGLNQNGLSNEHYIVMYAQREYLVNWEKIRLDVDHILPSSWMSFRAGPIPESRFWKVEKIDSWWRHQVLNRSGNKRYWPDSLNRINKDVSPQNKYINSITDNPIKDHQELYRNCGLEKVSDILEASAIDEDLAEKWVSLSTITPRVWTTERFLDFRWLVDERRIRMYSHLYETLRFSEWEDL